MHINSVGRLICFILLYVLDTGCMPSPYMDGEYMCTSNVDCLDGFLCLEGLCRSKNSNVSSSDTPTTTDTTTIPTVDTPEVFDCSDNPCVHGQCYATTDSFTCECEAGWAGDSCSINKNDCTVNSCVHGQCVDGVNNYSCDCQFGWSGAQCNVMTDNCSNSPCVNGQCNNIAGGFSCTCDVGWSGTTCNINPNDCDYNSCNYHGTCTDLINGYSCSCDNDWTGSRCDINVDDCSPNLCVHGTCSNTSGGGFTCSCPSGWGGTLCDSDINDCLPLNPCGPGTCTDNAAGSSIKYSCSCNLSNVAPDDIPMVPVYTGSRAYSVDSTEYTIEQYLYNRNNNIYNVSAGAGWPVGDKSYISSTHWYKGVCGFSADPGYEKYPLTYVSWYSARDICSFEGKRLCTKGTTTDSQEWILACQLGSGESMPYGAEYVPGTCNDSGYGLNQTIPVGSLPQCSGSYIYDMSGNVKEWVDDISISNGEVVMGGSFKSATFAELFCGANQVFSAGYQSNDIGFRCCAD